MGDGSRGAPLDLRELFARYALDSAPSRTLNLDALIADAAPPLDLYRLSYRVGTILKAITHLVEGIPAIKPRRQSTTHTGTQLITTAAY